MNRKGSFALVALVALALACGRGTDSTAPLGSNPPPPAGEVTPEPVPGEPAEPPPPASVPSGGLTCADRRYDFPFGDDIEGFVPCSGGVCVESAPAGMGRAFLAGGSGSSWAISKDAPAFLRLIGDDWIATCPPPGAASITAVHGDSGDDVWVGGPGGYLAHWNGLAWVETPSPVSGEVTGVWGDAAEAFASVRPSLGTRDGPLLRWNGIVWTDTGATGRSPRANGAGEAWALSGDDLLEWTGAGWERIGDFPPEIAISDLWAPPGGDLWIAGLTPPDPSAVRVDARVLRRESGRFVDMALPSTDGGHPQWIRGSGPDDVWTATQVRDMRSPARQFRWNGARWSEVPGTSSSEPPHFAAPGEPLVWHFGRLERLGGEEPGAPVDPGNFDVWTVSAVDGEVWFGGLAGLWRLADRTLRPVGVNVRPIIAIHGFARDDVWVFDAAGEPLRWNGSSLERLPPLPQDPAPFGLGLLGIAPAGAGRVWAIAGRWVGHPVDCSLWRWDGAEWSMMPMPLDGCPGLSSGPSGDPWLSHGGDLWHRGADGAWERHALPSEEIAAVVVRGDGDVWSAGDGVFHYDGSGWRKVGGQLVGSLAVGAADDVWAYASEHRTGDWGLWHWDGTRWTELPTRFVPGSVAALGGGEMWGVGGAVMHVRPRVEP